VLLVKVEASQRQISIEKWKSILPAGMVATFTVHVGENLTHDQLRGLVEWIRRIPKIKEVHL
jgi:hypothetical protein